MIKISTLILLLLVGVATSFAQTSVSRGGVTGLLYSNLAYKSGAGLSAYEIERCKLDIYKPQSSGSQAYKVIVYFHGGGLNSGDKTEGWADWSNNFGYKFLEQGILMVMVNYRLSGVSGTIWPAYLRDAASAVAWVQKNIGSYGGDPKNVFVMGFSAGAYLTHMLAIDPTWYNEIGFDRSLIRAYCPISGQTRGHATVAADLKCTTSQLMSLHPEAMPLGKARLTEKPMHQFVGSLEGQTITDNYEYFNKLSSFGSTNLFIYTQSDKDHGGMRDGLGDVSSPTRTKIVEFVNTYKYVAPTCIETAIPGTLEVENYCNMSGISKETTTDTNGGQNIGSFDTNDWFTSKINVAKSGTYTVQCRVASLNGGGVLKVERGGGGVVYGTINIPKTNGWQTWTTISQTIELPAGIQDLGFVATTGGFNINWINLILTPTNLAIGKTVSVSSSEIGNNIASNAVDGNNSTRWSSTFADNQNFIIDLGAIYSVNRFKINWESAYASQFQIQTSVDNINWSNVYSNYSFTGGISDVTFAATNARYVKMYGIKRATAYGFSFWEFEVYGLNLKDYLNSDLTNVTNNQTVIIYPNPASDSINVSTGIEDGTSKLEIIGLDGKLIYTTHIIGSFGIVDISKVNYKGLVLAIISNSVKTSSFKLMLK